MKIKTCRKVKDYESIFTKEKEIREVELHIGNYRLYITEHQCGRILKKPHISIQTNIYTTHEMDYDEFIKVITGK